eukprot:1176495-Amphidinium_carterae.2
MLRDHIAAFARSAGLYTQVEQLLDPGRQQHLATTAVAKQQSMHALVARLPLSPLIVAMMQAVCLHSALACPSRN